MDWFSNLFGGIGKLLGNVGGAVGKGIGGVTNLLGQAAFPYVSNWLGGMFKGGQTNQGFPLGMFTGGKGSGATSAISAPYSGILSSIGPINPIGTGTNLMSLFGQKQPTQPASTPLRNPVGQGISSAFKNFTGQLLGGGQLPMPGGGGTPGGGGKGPEGGNSKIFGSSGGNLVGNLIQSLFTPQASGRMGIFGQNPIQTLGGAGIGMLGNLFSRTPKMPDISQLQSYKNLQNLQLPPELQAATEADIKRIEDEEMRQFIAAYKNLRPGADIESDSVYKRDLQNLQDRQLQRRVQQMAQARMQYGTILETLAQADIDSQKIQYALDYVNAMKRQELFGNIGGLMMQSGLGLTTGATK